MSETGHPFWYMEPPFKGALAVKGEGWVTVLLESMEGKEQSVELRAGTVMVRDLPHVPEAITEGCIWEQLTEWSGGAVCKAQPTGYLNGWSAGPCPLCEEHRAAVVREMGDEGFWWTPVWVRSGDLVRLIEAGKVWVETRTEDGKVFVA